MTSRANRARMITRRLLPTNPPERERVARRASERQALPLVDIRIQLAGLHALLQKAEELDEPELILVSVRKTLSDLIENIMPQPDEYNFTRRCPLLWKETGTPIHRESARRKPVA